MSQPVTPADQATEDPGDLTQHLGTHAGKVLQEDDNYTYELRSFGDLQEGDEVATTGGRWQQVARAYPEHVPVSMYEIEVGGTVMQVSGNHLFYVESDLDRQLHASRLKTSAKTLQKHLSQKALDDLWEIVNDDSGYEIEMLLSDMVNLLEASGDLEVENIITRVAESIGPISEVNVVPEDVETGRRGSGRKVAGYDGRRFAQQLLSLTGIRKYRKRWPVIVGRVVTTEEMLGLMESFDVHLPNPPKH